MPEYHLIQRKRKNGRRVLYAAFPEDDGTGRYSKMVRLRTAPADMGKVRDKARRDREAHQEIVELQEAGKLGPSSSLATYLLDFWDYERSEYVRSKFAEGRTVSPHYCRNNKALVEHYFLPYMQHRKVYALTDLSKKVLLEWRNNLFEHGRIKLPGEKLPIDEVGNPISPPTISPTTQNKVRQAVHVALEHAAAIDLIPSNPLASLKRVAEQPTPRIIFEREELLELFLRPWPDIRAHAGCLLAVTAALRLGEVRGLLVRNVDFSQGRVNVVTNWQDAEGLKPPKWRKDREQVTVPNIALRAMEAVVQVHPFGANPDDFLFYGESPDRPVAKHTLQRGLTQAMKAAGIPRRGRSFHSLRHTAASHVVGTAGPERTQRILGHTTLAMTAHYSHPTEADREIVLRAQEGVWTPSGDHDGDHANT